MNHKLMYTAPQTEEILLRPEVNFCESIQDLTMPDTILDELESLPFIW